MKREKASVDVACRQCRKTSTYRVPIQTSIQTHSCPHCKAEVKILVSWNLELPKPSLFPWRMPCPCGATDARWRGKDELRVYLCDVCWRKVKA